MSLYSNNVYTHLSIIQVHIPIRFNILTGYAHTLLRVVQVLGRIILYYYIVFRRLCARARICTIRRVYVTMKMWRNFHGDRYSVAIVYHGVSVCPLSPPLWAPKRFSKNRKPPAYLTRRERKKKRKKKVR